MIFFIIIKLWRLKCEFFLGGGGVTGAVTALRMCGSGGGGVGGAYERALLIGSPLRQWARRGGGARKCPFLRFFVCKFPLFFL